MSALTNTTLDGGNGGSYGPPRIWRGEVDGEGEPIFVEVDREDYGIVPRGEHVLRVTGIQEERTEPNKFYDATDPKSPQSRTLTAVEFEVAAGDAKGVRFLIDFLTLSLSSGKGGKFPPSNLYRIWSAACPNGGKSVGDMIGGLIIAYLKHKVGDDGAPRYMQMTYDTCAPAEATEAPPAQEIPAQFKRAA